MTTRRPALAAEDTGPPRTFGPITRTDIVRYAGAVGDFNPLHHDDEFAINAGFAGAFSIGMLGAGLLGTYLTDWLGVSGLRRFKVRFREQVWPGDVLSCSGRVRAIDPEPDGNLRIEIELSCLRQTGAPAVTGAATLVRPAESSYDAADAEGGAR
jgi:acyl dehydratase